jgi:hypothetical protein
MSPRRLRRGLVLVTSLGGVLSACSEPTDSFRLDPAEIVGVTATEDAGRSIGMMALRPSSDSPDMPVAEAPGTSSDTPSVEAPGISSDTPIAEALGISSHTPSVEAVGGARDALDPEGPGVAQQVFLDFDGGVPTFDVMIENPDGSSSLVRSLPSHVYTAEERASIEALIAADIKPFGISVSNLPPGQGAFSTLTFNGPLPIRLVAVAGGGFLVNGSFGDSDAIDHRNRNPADGAVIAAHLWEFFVQTDPSGRSFSAASGLVVDAGHPLAARLSEAVVQQSANTAAHELGHLLGLRHHDGFGPPGSGLPSGGLPSPLEFVPPFEGPLHADETTLHLMSTGRTGATPRVRATVDQFFSERSAVKITAGQRLTPTLEAEARSSALEPVRLSVPNPVLEGIGAGPSELVVQTLLVDASLSSVDEVDEFRLLGAAGEVWTIDLVSTADPSFANPVVTDLRLLLEQPDGTRDLIAFNAQSFEGDDPVLLDIELPSSGTYVVQIDAPDTVFIDSDGDGFGDDPISLEESGLGALRTGDYELLLYSFVP